MIDMQSKTGRFMLFLWLCVMIGLCGCLEKKAVVSYPAMSQVTVLTTAAEVRQEEIQEILVHVCGAVCVPGVYRLKADARVYEAVEAAGGFREDAQSTAVNLADVLADGQQIRIPAVGETAAEAVSGDGKISINRAAKGELMQLPGIGESRAEAIIAYRTEHGNFSKPEDIMLVPGIKEAAYAKLKDRITAD